MNFTHILRNKYLIFYLFGGLLLLLNVYLAVQHLFYGDLMFHTDIARDFLLMQDIVVNKHLALIGPRAGGIPGVFFGPVWYYMNAPFFALGNGNPVIVGYFWAFLSLFSIGIVYFVARKLFDPLTAFLSALIYSFYITAYAIGFTQSFGSMLFSPLLFYFFYLFIKQQAIKYLVFSILLNGLILQLQPAFGILTLLSLFVASIIYLWKIKKTKYLLLFFLLIIPLFSYVLFELRHNFLEIRALISFLFHPDTGHPALDLIPKLQNRWDGFVKVLTLVEDKNIFSQIAFITINLFIFYKTVIQKNGKKTMYLLFYGYYLSFWLLTLLFKGLVWEFYYWGIIPLAIIFFSSLVSVAPKKIAFPFIGVVLFFLILSSIHFSQDRVNNFYGVSSSSWLLNYTIAKAIYTEVKGEDFGYYVYSPDELGYSIKYAMNYVQKANLKENGYLCRKKPTTYLIYYPTPKDAITDNVFWKEKKVNITSKPQSKKSFGEGIVVEKYVLTNDEVNKMSDSTIICDMSFR